MTAGLNCSSLEVLKSRSGSFFLIIGEPISIRDPAPNDGAGRPHSNSTFPSEHCGVVTPG
eukprot:12931984-Prorocentrum_lima.AAC.1